MQFSPKWLNFCNVPIICHWVSMPLSHSITLYLCIWCVLGFLGWWVYGFWAMVILSDSLFDLWVDVATLQSPHTFLGFVWLIQFSKIYYTCSISYLRRATHCSLLYSVRVLPLLSAARYEILGSISCWLCSWGIDWILSKSWG
jgi:hypothetical protein